MRIRNWRRHQHYSNRCPPWIKLHRDLLNDPEVMALKGDEFKLLVCLWLIASEQPEGDGTLPPLKTIAYRLHMTESALTKGLRGLAGFIEMDASTPLAECLQHATSEGEGETERETEGESFNEFWEHYPHRVGKKAARKAWAAAKDKPDLPALLNALDRAKRSKQWADGFIPHPATWLNGERWNDEPQKAPAAQCRPDPRDGLAAALYDKPDAPAPEPMTREELAEIDRQVAEARANTPSLRRIGGDE
ncbi:MAG: hypothetical protein GY851_09340 [bacterium]|nr:hypothetical protein [bacterium]